jgi:hypothetical protein
MLRLLLFMAFTYYKSVTIASAQCGASDSSNFPVTIWVTDADLKTTGNGGKVQNSSGFDIRPYADVGLTSALTFELVANTYVPTTGAVEMHVKIPTVSHTVDTVFYLAFGDSSLSTDGSSTSTWDSFYQGVWHLPNGTSLTVGDSTSHANTGTNSSATAASGEVDGAASMNGSGQHIVLPFAGITSAQFGTLSFWAFMRANANGFNAVYESADGSRGLALYVNSAGQVSFNGAFPGVSSGTAWTTSAAWAYVVSAVAPDGAGFFTTTNYQNGTSVNTDSGTPFSAQNVDFGDNPSGGGSNWDGLYDEVRWSVGTAAAQRSADWILAEYNNQKPSSTFLTFGALTPVSGAGKLFFLIPN